tara:strand:- start:25827 stop:26594 length:768 start_codon:yes stop_codon:yes gene_type:complete
MIIETDKPKEVDYNKRANIALGVGAFAVIVLPFVFTQLPGIVDFTETGQIGDTIGGITAPFVGLVGALLVYYSFKQQMIANQIQVDSLSDLKVTKRDDQLIKIIFDDSKTLLNLIESYKISSDFINEISYNGRVEKDYYGMEGVLCFYGTLIENKDYDSSERNIAPDLASMMIINNSIGILLMHINKITSHDTKEIYLERYFFQIQGLFYSLLYTNEADFRFDSSSVFFEIWEISKANIELYEAMKNSIKKLKGE